jgi:sterol desaturase/sphingolipid hydroxylase (fatty acid hydroxylase superfamily)
MLLLILECTAYFLVWNFIIYWMHRWAHNVPIMMRLHREHHKFIRENSVHWHWNNVLLFNDNWPSTFDFWVTEVIPTLLFAWITGQWWLLIAYYVYSALILERFEHNPNFTAYPWYVSGKWHVLHHTHYPCNYGIIIPFWDWVFKTNRIS